MTEGLTAETAATKQRLSAGARQLDRANAQGIHSGRPMNTSTSSTKPEYPKTPKPQENKFNEILVVCYITKLRMEQSSESKPRGRGRGNLGLNQFTDWEVGSDYVCEKLLGTGSYGKVALATKKSTG